MVRVMCDRAQETRGKTIQVMFRSPLPPGREPQPQPIDVQLLGATLGAMGDLDAPVMAEYAVGVPLGLGVNLPHTPMVFPPKTRWSLSEQSEWGGDSLRAKTFKGRTRENYPSARAFLAEVEKVLRAQAAQGQILILPEGTARIRYGDRLTIA